MSRRIDWTAYDVSQAVERGAFADCDAALVFLGSAAGDGAPKPEEDDAPAPRRSHVYLPLLACDPCGRWTRHAAKGRERVETAHGGFVQNNHKWACVKCGHVRTWGCDGGN